MPPEIEPISTLLQWRLDATGFLAGGLLIFYAGWVYLRRLNAHRVIPSTTWGISACLLLGAVGTTEWVAGQRQQSLADSLLTLAPAYALGLQNLGHVRIDSGTPPNDNTYQTLQSALREWNRLNRSPGELFTFRREGDGIAVVMDAGPASPEHQLSPAAPFLRALGGDTFFDPTLHANSRGTWVRAFAPIRDASGRVEAALVLSYPAASLLQTVATARVSVLGVSLVLLAGLVAMGTFAAVLFARLREHHATERELHNAKIAADEASRAKSDFLAVMSHEIRTPLNAVMGFANLLAESELDEAQRGYVATITSEGGRLGSLVNDLLDLSKIEEGRLVLERLPFAPAETALEVLRLLNGRAQEKKLELRFEAQLVGPLLVAGDPLRFRQVLINLVDNAIKFTPQGSVTVFLRWQPPAKGASPGKLEVRVRDTGIGIPAEKISDLFQKFMQADTSMTRRYGGTGLGLAICQRLVNLMGGQIEVQSKLGQGSEFSFSLPLTPVALTVEAAPAEAEAEFLRHRPPHILVVDDMETNRFLLEVFLRRNGFEPRLASGGEEAVRLAAQHPFDAILMDLQMPDIDGYEATRQIRRAETPGQHIPIIALTAAIARGTREKCLAAGMDEHLTKPLDLRLFKKMLNQLLAKSEPPPPEPPASG